MIRHGDPGDPHPPETNPPSDAHGNYPPAFPIPPVGSSIDAKIAARVGALGPAPNPANNSYLALNYYKQLVANFEVLLPTSQCATCNPTTIAPDSTWSGLAIANLVEHLGGAIVSPHSQSGIHMLHAIRILRERGKLHLLKGIIIPESAISLTTMAQAGITVQDFDTRPVPAHERRLPQRQCAGCKSCDACRHQREPDSLRRPGDLCRPRRSRVPRPVPRNYPHDDGGHHVREGLRLRLGVGRQEHSQSDRSKLLLGGKDDDDDDDHHH